MSPVNYEDILPGETEAALQKLALLAAWLTDALHDLELIEAVHNRAHAVAPIFDPTAYARGMKNLDEQAQLLGPILDASRKIAPVVRRAQLRGGK